SLPILAKANMLFAFSEQLQLKPGHSAAADVRILDYIRKSISENIKNPDVVVSELIEAWNTVAAFEKFKSADPHNNNAQKHHGFGAGTSTTTTTMTEPV